ncbi:MAG: dephospho-CoA kinase [Thermodesulfovibrionales bacterium]
MIKVALTGNIGMGKTTVGKVFSSLGALVINTDDVVSQLLNSDEVKKRIIAVFGRGILSDQVIDKKALAELVFNDAKKRAELEDIIHPLVFEEVDRIASNTGKDCILIVEAPIIFERGYQGLFDKTITVFCDENTAINRLMSKGINKDDAIARIRAQMPIEKKCALSDFLIDNNKGINDLYDQVLAIYKILERMADGRGKGDI